MRTNQDLYVASFLLIVSLFYYKLVGYIFNHNLNLVLLGLKNESRLNHHLSGLFGVSSLAWTGHLVHVAIPEARGIHVGWDNF
jgi:photosystem I P700 chlorophyll a apoprotein A2